MNQALEIQEFTAESLAAAQAELASDSSSSAPILFAGTPAVAARALEGLISSGAQIAAVLTRPDAPVGRKRRLTASPVADTAQEHGLPVIKADAMEAEVVEQIRASGAQLGVVVAYGALLPESALQALPLGWVNLHYSALPAYRGAAPVQHAILQGETTTAATVFQLERGMDTGPIHAMVRTPIPEATSCGAMLETLTDLGTSLLCTLLPKLLAGESVPVSQRGEPSLAPKLDRKDAFIDPRRPAQELVQRINATIPEPGAWTLNGEDRIKLGAAHRYYGELPQAPSGAVLMASAPQPSETQQVVLVAGDGAGVVLNQVQPAGKQMMNALDWHRGLRQEQVRLGGHDE